MRFHKPPLFAFLLGLVLLGFGPIPQGAFAKESGRVTLSIPVAQLPKEGREVLALIKKGGPFRYGQDGVIFQNRERRLPLQKMAYYHEYTVPTPGSKDRGARRIIAAVGPGNNVKTSGEYYYTDDHYQSFRRIKE